MGKNVKNLQKLHQLHWPWSQWSWTPQQGRENSKVIACTDRTDELMITK
jgi:hypothetical protein